MIFKQKHKNMRNGVVLFSPLHQVGGIASWTKNILAYMQSKGISSIIHVDSSLHVSNDVNTSRLNRFIRGIWQTPRLFFALWKSLRINKPQYVWRTCSGSLGFYRDELFGLLCKIYGTRSVVHFRFGRVPILCKCKNWEYKVMCNVIKHSYKCIVIDRPSYDALCALGFKEKVVLIPNPCAPDVQVVANSLIINFKQDKYLFVGHVIKSKGIYELVKAFVDIPYELNLEVIGPYENSIKEDVEEIALLKDNGRWLIFSGVKDKSYIIESMKKAKALVLPSYTEGFPNVVLEAMACGCPVLATNVGAIPFMIDCDSDRPCGICFEKHSVKSIVDVLNKFTSEEEMQKYYAINGKLKVLKSYTMDVVFPLYSSLFK